MKSMRKNLFNILVILAFMFTACENDDEMVVGEAQYQVTFNMQWNMMDFPVDYPSNAHFSKLIGWSHNSASTFFEPGTIASDGIKNMAEKGEISPLDNEINDLIASGEGLGLVVGSNLASGTGEITVNVNVDREHPSVTLSTMIAPSPDWYVAVVNINLLENGQFVSDKTINASVYDAGTDSGITFTSGDDETNPKQPVSLIVSPPLGNGTSISPPIGTVTFTKQ